MKNWILVCALLSLVTGCTCSRNNKSANLAPTPVPTVDPNKTPDYTGITVPTVVKIDSVIGKKEEATVGSKVVGKYGMWVYSPKQIGNRGKSIKPDGDGTASVEFVLGSGTMIKGFEAGVIGMKVGGKRSIIIPPADAFGEKGTEVVPPNAIVLVEFELLKVSK